MHYESWGRYPQTGQQNAITFSWLDELQSRISSSPSGTHYLPRGLGRSYGDSCLVDSTGTLLDLQACNRILEFDRERGILSAEAGASFDQILRLIVPAGWFLPVTPGTKFVTLAGAIANDIHGKNHHAAGNFGNHVIDFELLRSDGRVLRCSENDAAESETGSLFRATIGGIGLTGVILRARFRLRKIENPLIDQEIVKYRGIREFVELSSESEALGFEYTVSWVDCLSSGEKLRGLFIRGNHAQGQRVEAQMHGKPKLAIPVDFPNFALNPLSVRAFNELYYRKQFQKKKVGPVHFDPFFYPLDSILMWNRIYGSRGFLQYQFVVPYESDQGEAVNEIMGRIARSGQGSFLAVLKVFGAIPGRGMLSFPRPGITLALDFKNTGEPLYRLLQDLDRLVISAGGALYPAKDARMSKESFLASFPEVTEFKKWMDPVFGSRFSNRVGLTT